MRLGSPVDAEEDPQSERRRFRKPHESFFDYQPQKSSNHPATMDSSRQDWFLREKLLEISMEISIEIRTEFISAGLVLF